MILRQWHRPAAAPAEPETKAASAGDEKTVAAIEDEARRDRKRLVVVSMVMTGDAEGVRRAWGAFLAEIVHRPLLYVPLARGGDARKIAAAWATQQTFRELLRHLPRMGLLRETCQLLRVARGMEKQHPPGPGAVTEFDRLFELGYQGIVESLVEASLGWNRGKTAGGFLLTEADEPHGTESRSMKKCLTIRRRTCS